MTDSIRCSVSRQSHLFGLAAVNGASLVIGGTEGDHLDYFPARDVDAVTARGRISQESAHAAGKRYCAFFALAPAIGIPVHDSLTAKPDFSRYLRWLPNS